MSKKVFRFKKKWIVLLSLSLVLSSAIVFRKPLFKASVETYLGLKMPGYGGWKFSYRKIKLRKNRLVIDDIDLKTKGVGTQVHLNKLSAVVERAGGINLALRFEIEEPVVEVERVESQSDFSLASIMQGPLERYKVDVSDGLIKFVDAEGRVDLFFSLEGDAQRRSIGVFYLSEAPVGEKDVSAMVKLYQWPKELIIESELRDARVVWLSRIVNFFQGGALDEWKNLEGVVSGHSWIGLDPKGGINQTTANIDVESFSCESKAGDFGFKMDELSLDFSFPSGGRKIDQKDVWWQSLALKSQIQGGVARFKDADWGADFTLSDIEGTLNFSTFKDSQIQLKGFLHQSGEISPIVVSGNPSLVDKDSLDLDMRLFLEPESQTSTHLKLLVSSTGKDSCLVRGQLREIDAPQIKMFQHLIGFAMPDVKDIHFNKGAVTCELSLIVNEGHLSKLLLENMVADDLELYVASRDMAASAKSLEASAQLDLDVKEKFTFPSWKLKVADGEMVKGKNSEDPLTFTDINLEVFMCRDVFEPSWAKAKYDDVYIDLDVVGFFSEANVKLNVSTPLQRAMRFFDPFDESLKEQFDGYNVGAAFNIRRQLGYWDVSGAVNLDVRGDWVDKIDLGFHLSDQIMKYEEKQWPALLQESISKGTFQAKNISCEFNKILKHFTEADLDLEGMISFEGVFSATHLDADIESSYLSMSTPAVDVRLNSVLDADTLVTSEGKVHFNFLSGQTQAYFPLYQGVISEKNLGLLFTDTQAQVYFDGKSLRLEDVSTEVDGLAVKGWLDLSLDPAKDIALDILTSEITGSTSSLQAFLNNLEKFKDLKFPFEGRVFSDDEGLSLNMVFPKEGETIVEWTTDFSLAQGTLPLSQDVALGDMRLDFTMDSRDHKMYLSNLFGKLKTKGEDREYFVSAKEVEIDYTKEDSIEAGFDLRLENSMMDLARVVGGFDGSQNKIYLDTDLSHLLGTRLNGVKFELTDDLKLKEFTTSTHFSVDEISLASRIFEDLGYSSLVTAQIRAHASAMAGAIETQISYKDEKLEALIDTEDFSYGTFSHLGANFNLEVTKDAIRLVKGKVGRFGIEGALVNEDAHRFIDGLAIAIDDERIPFERGEWHEDKKKWIFPINLEKFDLGAYFEHAPSLDLKGDIEMAYESHSSPFSASFDGDMALKEGGGSETALTSLKGVHIEYNKERGILVKDSTFCLMDQSHKILFEVPTLVFHTEDKMCQGYRIKTLLTDDLLSFLTNHSGVEVNLSELSLPNKDNAEIVFDFEYAKDRLEVGGVLPKGIYHYKNRPYDLDEVNFHVNEQTIEAFGTLNYLTKRFGFHVKTHPYSQYDTVIEAVALADEDEKTPLSKKALHIECKLNDEEGVTIEKVEGDLFGLDFHFVPKNLNNPLADRQSFFGSVKLNMEEMRPLLDGDLIQLVDELKLGSGYELSGELHFKGKDYTKPIFQGFFKGRDFDLLGYQFKTCFSSITIDDNGADIHDFKISDDAITVDLKEIQMKPKNNDLALNVPEVMIKDLRPSLLQKRGKVRGRIKPFHIKNMVFTDVTGMLSEPKTLKGKGHLQFVNTFKQGANLLDIPIEIISRLGLDIGLLVPIQGEMDYVLKDGKVVFTKLKNSFSDNKRSYFFLWNKTESFVDLEGNMHIDIRMKQYVLFKITELFVLSVNGTLENPRFSLK